MKIRELKKLRKNTCEYCIGNKKATKILGGKYCCSDCWYDEHKKFKKKFKE
jgi:hypothetical protein